MALALSREEYETIIKTIRNGFENHKPNVRIATALVAQANLGLRIGDVVELRLNDIIREANRYRLDILEQKTGKKRTFTVNDAVYTFLRIYTLENGIKPTGKIFDISVRAIQKHLKICCEYLGYTNIATHSFRKYFATTIYEENNHDIKLVQELLQHSSVSTTQKYIGISSEKIEKALTNHVNLVI